MFQTNPNKSKTTKFTNNQKIQKQQIATTPKNPKTFKMSIEKKA